MVLHTWRDNARDIYTCWQRKFGAAASLKSPAHRIPPRPISGRWGRAYDCIAYILSSNFDEASQVFEEVMSTVSYYKVYLANEAAEEAQAAAPAPDAT